MRIITDLMIYIRVKFLLFFFSRLCLFFSWLKYRYFERNLRIKMKQHDHRGSQADRQTHLIKKYICFMLLWLTNINSHIIVVIIIIIIYISLFNFDPSIVVVVLGMLFYWSPDKCCHFFLHDENDMNQPKFWPNCLV